MDHVAVLLIELGAIYALLSLLGLAARRIGLSPIPLFLLGGLLFGSGGLVPVGTAMPFVDTAAEIGVILLLLTLGLEFSPTELVGSLRTHKASGILDFVLNAPPGFVAGRLLGFDWPACVALAGVTWVSSSGIIARLLHDLGRLANRETPVILSVLVLEDIAMAVFLPIMAVALKGGAPLQALGGVALALGAVMVVLTVAYRWGERVGRLLAHPEDEQVLMRLVGLTLLVAGIAQLVGASAAVGAFLVGLSVPASFAERARQVLNPLRDLFASAFFVGFGLEIAVGDLVPYVGPAVVLALITMCTKVATGWLAAGWAGIARPGRLRAGTTLIVRGEFSIVIAGLATRAGAGAVGPLAAAYVLLLAIGGPIVARVSEPLARSLRPRRSLPKQPPPPLPGTPPIVPPARQAGDQPLGPGG